MKKSMLYTGIAYVLKACYGGLVVQELAPG